MESKVLGFINRCEGWKVAIKGLHWDSSNLSQHELCDEIADLISDFEDSVSEVAQSISGKRLGVGSLKPISYKVVSLEKFVKDVLDGVQSFLKDVRGMGKDYVGIASDCEGFISSMQRKLYLVRFTLSESRLNRIVNESINGVLMDVI